MNNNVTWPQTNNSQSVISFLSTYYTVVQLLMHSHQWLADADNNVMIILSQRVINQVRQKKATKRLWERMWSRVQYDEWIAFNWGACAALFTASSSSVSLLPLLIMSQGEEHQNKFIGISVAQFSSPFLFVAHSCNTTIHNRSFIHSNKLLHLFFTALCNINFV